MELERRGIPTVTVCTHLFVTLGNVEPSVSAVTGPLFLYSSINSPMPCGRANTYTKLGSSKEQFTTKKVARLGLQAEGASPNVK